MSECIDGHLETRSKTPKQRKLAYSVDETLNLLSIGRTTLYAKLKSGELRARKCGRKTLILSTDLEAFVESLETAK